MNTSLKDKNNEAIIQISNLEKTMKNNNIFEKNWSKTLWKIPSLELKETGLTCIVGRNGAGKSTLLRCLLGLIQPTCGEVKWFGKKEFPYARIGYVPEFPIIPPSIKVSHWIRLVLGNNTNIDTSSTIKSLQKTSLNVEPFLNVPANRLSKGQQQRVQLWMALSSEPDVVVLDEPFSGLDPWARGELSQVVTEILSLNKVVILSTHELTAQLREQCQRTWQISDSKVVDHSGCALPH
jgi:ABC-2 type transport system ATP-binding protein